VRLAIGADHAGYRLATTLRRQVEEAGWATSWHGADGNGPYDYPDAAAAVAAEVGAGSSDFGLLVCGSGIGMSIAANRDPRIRAAVCWNTESARLAREHNGANVLCLGARLLDEAGASEVLRTFLETSEDDSERHLRRRQKLGASAACG
jgi:ribose 5-phosphate isomerase B